MIFSIICAAIGIVIGAEIIMALDIATEESDD